MDSCMWPADALENFLIYSSKKQNQQKYYFSRHFIKQNKIRNTFFLGAEF